MTPKQFLDQVVVPNAEELRKAPDDLRLAVNAFLSCDALLGILWISGKAADLSDGSLRDRVAQTSQCYSIVRDYAFALKHGELAARKHVVRSPEAAAILDTRWNDGAKWTDMDTLVEQAVVVDVNNKRLVAYKLLEVAIAAVQREISGEPAVPDTIDDAIALIG